MTSSNQDPNRNGIGNRPDDTDNGKSKQKIEDLARDAKHDLSDKAREKAEAGQHRVADEVDALSDAIDAAATNLDDHDREGLAQYARELSNNLATAAGQLEGRSVDQLANDAKRLARKNPGLFMLGSIAVGFGLSRFFKANAEHDHHREDSAHWHDNNAPRPDVSARKPVQQREQGMPETYTATTASRSDDGRNLL